MRLCQKYVRHPVTRAVGLYGLSQRVKMFRRGIRIYKCVPNHETYHIRISEMGNTSMKGNHWQTTNFLRLVEAMSRIGRKKLGATPRCPCLCPILVVCGKRGTGIATLCPRYDKR